MMWKPASSSLQGKPAGWRHSEPWLSPDDHMLAEFPLPLRHQSFIPAGLQLLGAGPAMLWGAICFAQSLVIEMFISSKVYLHRNI